MLEPRHRPFPSRIDFSFPSMLIGPFSARPAGYKDKLLAFTPKEWHNLAWGIAPGAATSSLAP